MRILKSSVIPLGAIFSAILLTSLLLIAYQVPPVDALQLLFSGALTTRSRMSDMLMLAAPLLLCAIGLTVSFAAGQYNLGIEGQMTIGGVASMWVMRAYNVGDAVILYWMIAIVVGAAAGMLWALLIALLKQYTRVSEIFAGLGLNFVALGTSLYFVFGPWKRPGVASMSGTEPLDKSAWLPTLEATRLAWPTPIIAVCVLILIWWVIRHTHWGLQVRASGLSVLASERMGVPAVRRMFEAMALCGGIAGVAGALQVLGVYHALVPNVASGIGFLGLLVALLARADIRWVAPLAIFFAIVTSGSIQLPLALSTDSSIAGVLQGLLVLAMIIARSIQRRGEA
jgi:simple sugar transport system permease protein